MRLLTLIATLLTALSLAAAGAPDARAADDAPALRTELVTVKHVAAGDVVSVLRAFQSPHGKLDFNDQLNLITISDRDALVDKMLSVVAEIDVPRPELELTVFLVEASAKGEVDADLKEALGPIWEDLTRLFSYRGYAERDRAIVRVTAGNKAAQHIGGDGGYQLEIGSRVVDQKEGTFQLGVHLTQLGPAPGGADSNAVRWRDIVQTSLEVRDGKTSVVGASRLNGDGRALITIIQTRVVR